MRKRQKDNERLLAQILVENEYLIKKLTAIPKTPAAATVVTYESIQVNSCQLT